MGVGAAGAAHHRPFFIAGVATKEARRDTPGKQADEGGSDDDSQAASGQQTEGSEHPPLSSTSRN